MQREHREFDSAEEAYIDAIYNLSQLICRDSLEIKRLEVHLIHYPLDKEATEEFWKKKADLINEYSQRFLRGGLN